MAVIGLSGPHAIGKTTAVRRWLSRYRRLTAILADNQIEETAVGRIKVQGWQGKEAEKARLVSEHREYDTISVIESARTTALNYFLPAEPVILVVCSWETMDRFMRGRCAARGKTFRAEYWHPRRIETECKTRYVNYAQKHLHPDQYCIFEVNDYGRDWPQVDEYFGSLYRRIHNRLNHRRGVRS